MGSVDGTVTRYVYDAEDIFLEYDYDGVMTNTLTARYGHGDRIDQPLTVERVVSGEEYFYHADHLGSIRALTDDMGDIVNEYVYDAYGRVLSITETVPQPYAFTGREYDAESALYYYRARYMRPAAGRFVSDDPIGLRSGDANLLSYVRNNPANYTDPSGLLRNPRDILRDGLRHPKSAPGTNGPGNAFQHCFATCVSTAENGGAITRAINNFNEVMQSMEGIQNFESSMMDAENNMAGEAIGEACPAQVSPNEERSGEITDFCESACDAATHDGTLRFLTPQNVRTPR